MKINHTVVIKGMIINRKQINRKTNKKHTKTKQKNTPVFKYRNKWHCIEMHSDYVESVANFVNECCVNEYGCSLKKEEKKNRRRNLDFL